MGSQSGLCVSSSSHRSWVPFQSVKLPTLPALCVNLSSIQSPRYPSRPLKSSIESFEIEACTANHTDTMLASEVSFSFYAILSMTSVPRCLLSLHCLFCPQFVQSIHFFTWLVLYNLFFNSSALYSALASALSVPSRQVPFACLVLRRRNCSPRPCKARDSASLYTINVVCFLITSALTRYRTDNWYFWYP